MSGALRSFKAANQSPPVQFVRLVRSPNEDQENSEGPSVKKVNAVCAAQELGLPFLGPSVHWPSDDSGIIESNRIFDECHRRHSAVGLLQQPDLKLTGMQKQTHLELNRGVVMNGLTAQVATF